jgi:hypothetical protein
MEKVWARGEDFLKGWEKRELVVSNSASRHLILIVCSKGKKRVKNKEHGTVK